MAKQPVRVRDESQLPSEEISLRSVYVEGSDDEGRYWQVDLEAVEEVEVRSNAGLVKGLNEERDANAALRAEVKALKAALPEGATAESVAEQLAKLQTFEESSTADEALREQMRQRDEASAQRMQTANARIADANSRQVLLDLKTAALKNGVNPDLADGHTALMASQMQIVEQDDGTFKEVFLDPAGQPMQAGFDDRGQPRPVTVDMLYEADKKRPDRKGYYLNQTQPGSGLNGLNQQEMVLDQTRQSLLGAQTQEEWEAQAKEADALPA